MFKKFQGGSESQEFYAYPRFAASKNYRKNILNINNSGNIHESFLKNLLEQCFLTFYFPIIAP